MPSKRLMSVWGFTSFLMLAAGVIALTISIVWRAPELMRNIVISRQDLLAGTIIGVAFLITFGISILAIIQPNHVIIGLVILNWTLIADAVMVLTVGSFIWFYTLRERNNFHIVMSHQSAQTWQAVQDKFSCCGYFNSTDLGTTAGFCSNPTTAVNATPCVGPITNYADYTLNNIFSSIYGFMAVTIALFLTTMCVIKRRQEEERFRRIDEKRGGRGFV